MLIRFGLQLKREKGVESILIRNINLIEQIGEYDFKYIYNKIVSVKYYLKYENIYKRRSINKL